MAGIKGGTSGLVAETGLASGANALHVQARPTSWGTLGHYKVVAKSGTIAAALAANAQLFTWRWTHASYLCVIHRIAVRFQALDAFTAATLTDFGFDLKKATSVSAGGLGTDIFASAPSKMRSTMAASQMVTGSARISDTVALTALTTLDAHPFASSIGDTQRVNPAAGTEEQQVNDPSILFAPNVAGGEHPLVLSQNEGFALLNRAVWPAAGTGIVQVAVDWAEVTAY